MSEIYQVQKSLAIAPGVYKTAIEGLFYIEYPQYLDERGLFAEILRPEVVRQNINPQFQIKQVNYSYSKDKVLRGLHTEGWNKLVTVVGGKALCVLADTRPDSPTYKKVEYFSLAFDHRSKTATALYISKKIANSIAVLEGPVRYVYGVDLLYSERDPADDLAISVFDPQLNINWPFAAEELILSERDRQCITLQEQEQKF